MQIVKVFNNNAALVIGAAGEQIVLGKGVGFGKKSGDTVDESKIERVFDRKATVSQPLQTVSRLNSQVIDLTNQVVDLAEQQLNVKFQASAYAALADHIDFLLERQKHAMAFSNQLVQWEIAKMYPKESKTALAAVELLQAKTNLPIANSEIVFLTYHFVNVSHDDTTLHATMN